MNPADKAIYQTLMSLAQAVRDNTMEDMVDARKGIAVLHRNGYPISEALLNAWVQIQRRNLEVASVAQ